MVRSRDFRWRCLASVALSIVATAAALYLPPSARANVPCDEWIYAFPTKESFSGTIDYPVKLTVGERVTLLASSCDGEYCPAVDGDELAIAFVEVDQDPESPRPGQPVVTARGTGPPLSIRTFRFAVPKMDPGPYGASMECEPDGWIGFTDVVVSEGPPDTATAPMRTERDIANGAILLLLVFGCSSLALSTWLSRR